MDRLLPVFLIIVSVCISQVAHSEIRVGDIVGRSYEERSDYEITRICTVTEVTGAEAKISCSKFDFYNPMSTCEFLEFTAKTEYLRAKHHYSSLYGVDPGTLLFVGGRPVTAQGFAIVSESATGDSLTVVEDQNGCWHTHDINPVEFKNFPAYGPEKGAEIYSFDPYDPAIPIRQDVANGYAFWRYIDFSYPRDTPLNQFPIYGMTYLGALGDPMDLHNTFWYEDDNLDSNRLKGSCSLTTEVGVKCISRVLWNGCDRRVAKPFDMCGEVEEGLLFDQNRNAFHPANFIIPDLDVEDIRAELGYYIEGSVVRPTSKVSQEKIAGFLLWDLSDRPDYKLPPAFLDQFDAYVRTNGLTKIAMAMTDALMKYLIFHCEGFNPQNPNADPAIRRLCTIDPQTGRMPSDIFAIDLNQIIH